VGAASRADEAAAASPDGKVPERAARTSADDA
jgi:hypothetical protein